MSDILLFQRFRLVKLINSAKGDISDIELFPSPRLLRFVNPATGDISDILLFQRCRLVRFVNSAKGERSVMLLLLRFKFLRSAKSESTGISTDASPILLSERLNDVRWVNLESTRTSAGRSCMPLGRSSVLRLVNPESGEISVMRLPERRSSVRWVNPDRDEMSVMPLFPRRSSVKLVKFAKGEMAVMLLFPRRRFVKLVKPAKDEISVIRLSLRCSSVKLVKPESTLANADTSFILLLESPNVLRLVSPESGEISVTLFLPSPSLLKLVNPESGEISVMPLSPRRSSVRLVANSSPISTPMEASLALKYVKVAISSGLIGLPDFNPKASSIAARRVGSGMCAPASATSLKVTVCSTPTADTVTRFDSFPSVSLLCALPFLSVVVFVTLSVPPLEMTVNVNGTPSNVRPLLSRTSTVSTLFDAVITPEIFKSVVAVRLSNFTSTPFA